MDIRKLFGAAVVLSLISTIGLVIWAMSFLVLVICGVVPFHWSHWIGLVFGGLAVFGLTSTILLELFYG